MKLATPISGTRILGLGAYRPERVVTNHDLAKIVDTSDEWIRTRVGIESRRYAASDETVVQMATAAGEKALAAAGLTGADIDLVIIATCTLPSQIPGAAPAVAWAIGADRPGAYDVNGACAGFAYAVAQASDAVRLGTARHALVVGAEKLTDWTDQYDRGTSIIFGDGAGAAVIGASNEPGISQVVWGSDGDKNDAIVVRDRTSMMEMDGQAVFRWATTKLQATVREICDRAGVTLEDIDVFAPHQANMRIIDAMLRSLKFREDVVIARDIAQSGNTSSASIPLALTALLETGQAKSGDLALTIGFGAGLTFAGQLIVLP